MIKFNRFYNQFNILSTLLIIASLLLIGFSSSTYGETNPNDYLLSYILWNTAKTQQKRDGLLRFKELSQGQFLLQRST